ncbi:hypothetical protein HKX48_000494 [Thoreauomyces humboldtii]|nr:hypothetical protein HKX48_000494 [Thoreauomyces humboldtii]
MHSSSEVILAIVVVVVVYLLLVQRPQASTAALAGVKYASEGLLPIVGHLPALVLNFKEGPKFFNRIAQRSSTPTVRIHIPVLPPIILTSDPAAIEQVLTQLDTFAKGHFFQSRSLDLFGAGIINSDGTMWKIQRKAGAGFFSPRNVKRWVEEVFPRHMTRVHHLFSRAADSGDQVDVQEVMLDFTLRVFLDIAYGVVVGCDEDLPADVRAFGDAFDAATAGIEYRFFAPWWKVEEMATSRGKEMKRNIAIVKDFGKDLVARRRKAMEARTNGDGDASQFDDQDLLSLFIECARRTENTDEEVTDDMLADWILNFLSAARDTTAQAITWTLFLVSSNPDVLGTLRSELERSLPSHEANIDHYKPKSLPYTHAVIHETLRLYPSVPMEVKEAQQEYPLFPLNGKDEPTITTKVPAGSIIVWSPYAMGRSSRLWGPDAETFSPGRWLEADDDEDATRLEGSSAPLPKRFQRSPPSPYVYPVFNGGPRSCLGKNLAVMEIACAVAAVVKRWDVKVVSGGQIGNGLTLPMRGGLIAFVKEI